MTEGGAEIHRVHAEHCCSPLKVHFKSKLTANNYSGGQEDEGGGSKICFGMRRNFGPTIQNPK